MKKVSTEPNWFRLVTASELFCMTVATNTKGASVYKIWLESVSRECGTGRKQLRRKASRKTAISSTHTSQCVIWGIYELFMKLMMTILMSEEGKLLFSCCIRVIYCGLCGVLGKQNLFHFYHYKYYAMRQPVCIVFVAQTTSLIFVKWWWWCDS